MTAFYERKCEEQGLAATLAVCERSPGNLGILGDSSDSNLFCVFMFQVILGENIVFGLYLD